MLPDPGQILIPLKYVAKALGWSTKLTRDRFRRCNLAVLPPGACQYSISRDSLLATMPQVVARVDELARLGELRRRPVTRGRDGKGRFLAA